MKHFLTGFCCFTLMLLIMPPAAITGPAPLKTTTLVIHITGFENNKGVARVAIVNSKENYASDSPPHKGLNCAIKDNQVSRTVILPYGEYALKVFHDENSNDELDTRMFGIPKERYGFSNNARGRFGPPDYTDACFILESPEQTISIQIQ